MSNNRKLWAVFAEEARPLCLVLAKTEGGAKRKYEINTGRSREGIYVEQVDFEQGYYGFASGV